MKKMLNQDYNECSLIITHKDYVYTDTDCYLVVRDGNGLWRLPFAVIPRSFKGNNYKEVCEQIDDLTGIKMDYEKLELLKIYEKDSKKIAVLRGYHKNPNFPARITDRANKEFSGYPAFIELRWIKSLRELAQIEFSKKFEYCQQFLSSQFKTEKPDLEKE